MIKLIVFDLGNVILPFEHRQIAKKLHEKSAYRSDFNAEEVFSFMFETHKGLINEFETGQISSEEFFGLLKDRYKLNLTFEGFKDIWNPIFTENLKVNEAILYLKSKGYPLFILSNTNELHFSYIIEKYPIVHEMGEWILSFEIGVKKPDAGIYKMIFEKMDVAGNEVFYIDDIEQYVDTARALGIKGMVFKNADQLWKEIGDIVENKRQ
ncbi:MAG TPA: HAD family phosphatase [Syntrophorhabdaceae bacterium]|nr:HAD family phosphatase [Syntrophorhabdaceae bacterium]